MYTPRAPSLQNQAHLKAHQELVELAATERAEYERGWRFVNDPGEPGLHSPFTMTTPVCFFKDSEGFILLAGRVGNAAFDSTIFILPIGYRPGKNLVQMDHRSGIPFIVYSDGRVATASLVIAATADVSLDGVQFRTN